MIFVSTMLYVLAKKFGLAGATQELMGQVQRALPYAKSEKMGNPTVPRWQGVQSALTIANAMLLDEVQLHVNAGATVIAKGRSVSASDFLDQEVTPPECKVWLACDDDTIASYECLAAMVSQASAEPCLVIAPAVLRGTERIAINEKAVAVRTRAPNGATLETIESGGFSCFAVSRGVVEAVHDAAGPELDWTDDAGKLRRAVFRDEIADGQWFTEDLAFCRTVKRLGFPIYVARAGYTIHNGERVDARSMTNLGPVAGS